MPHALRPGLMKMRLRIAARCCDCGWKTSCSLDDPRKWQHLHSRVLEHVARHGHDVSIVKSWLYGPR